MKRFIIILSCFLCISFIQSRAIAEEEKLSLTATASSVCYNYEPYYSPYKTVDGDIWSHWIGGVQEPFWWIMFDAGSIYDISYVTIRWYPGYNDFTATDFDVQVSDDGSSWSNIHSAISGRYCTGGDHETENIDTLTINHHARYLRLYIRQVYGSYYPLIMEFEAYGGMPTANLPRLIRFQGTLGNAEKAPLEGLFTLTFRLYNVETEGITLWEETQDVDIESGLLDVEFGSVTALDLAFDTQYWLGIEVESDGEMTPRFKLTSVPYAFISTE